MKYLNLISLVLLTSCSPSNSIDLKYKEQITVHDSFYGERCCKVVQKINSSTYRVYCEKDAPIWFPDIIQNQTNGVLIVKGCNK